MSVRNIDVEVKGLREVTQALRAYGVDIAKGVTDALNATGLEVLTDVRKRIQSGPKTGITYYRIPGSKYMTIRAGAEDGPPVAFIPGGGKQNKSLTHRASAHGQAPATDTGSLVSSTYYNLLNSSTVVIGSRLPYASMLEFGTLKIKKRPAWIPAAEVAKPRLQKRIERVIAQAKAQAEKKTR